MLQALKRKGTASVNMTVDVGVGDWSGGVGQCSLEHGSRQVFIANKKQ
jgi:hypothetical protein